MSTLAQANNSELKFIGWHGSCDSEPCQEILLRDVLDSSGANASHRIAIVLQISGEGLSANKTFSTYNPDNSDPDSGIPGSNNFNKLECGHVYYIKLKKGSATTDTQQVVLPGFTPADSETTEEYLLSLTCGDGDGGGGGGVANISFLNDSPSDNDDLRISIGANLTEINSLCTSNVWAYRIEKLNGENDESGTEVQGITFASGDQDSVTVLSNYLSSADGGASWYKVYIQGYASDQTTAVTDEISENVFMGWPTPSLTINGTTCSQTEWTALWQTDGIVNEIPHTNSHTNVDLITACQTKNVSCLEYEGPSNTATFNLSKYLISDMTMAPIQGNNIPADQNLWEYSIDDGEYFPFVPETTITDASKLQVRLSAKDGTGADWSPGNYSVDVIFGYKGMENSAATHVSYVKVNAEIKDRTIEIESLVDLDNLTMHVRVNRTNVEKWRYKLIGPGTPSIFEDTTAVRQGDLIAVSGGLTDGPGEYTVEVWGISFIDDEWKTVTPVDSETIQMNWPSPTLNLSDNINEGYEEESGPSRGDDILTITHNWVTEYTLHMPSNTDSAWEIRLDGTDVWTTIPTIATSYLTRDDQITMSGDVSDVYILRLKAGLPPITTSSSNGNNGYDRNLILNGTSKDGDDIAEKSTTVEGQVTVKPPCCNGMPNGNTFQTTGYGNNNMTPTVSASGIKVRTIGFDNDGKLCFSNGILGSLPDVYLVDLFDESGSKLVGGDGATEPFGSVNVQGTFTGSKDVVYEDPNGNCYLGELSLKSPARNQLHDPGRNEGPTLFGTE